MNKDSRLRLLREKEKQQKRNRGVKEINKHLMHAKRTYSSVTDVRHTFEVASNIDDITPRDQRNRCLNDRKAFSRKKRSSGDASEQRQQRNICSPQTPHRHNKHVARDAQYKGTRPTYVSGITESSRIKRSDLPRARYFPKSNCKMRAHKNDTTNLEEEDKEGKRDEYIFNNSGLYRSPQVVWRPRLCIDQDQVSLFGGDPFGDSLINDSDWEAFEKKERDISGGRCEEIGRHLNDQVAHDRARQASRVLLRSVTEPEGLESRACANFDQSSHGWISEKKSMSRFDDVRLQHQIDQRKESPKAGTSPEDREVELVGRVWHSTLSDRAVATKYSEKPVNKSTAKHRNANAYVNGHSKQLLNSMEEKEHDSRVLSHMSQCEEFTSNKPTTGSGHCINYEHPKKEKSPVEVADLRVFHPSTMFSSKLDYGEASSRAETLEISSDDSSTLCMEKLNIPDLDERLKNETNRATHKHASPPQHAMQATHLAPRFHHDWVQSRECPETPKMSNASYVRPTVVREKKKAEYLGARRERDGPRQRESSRRRRIPEKHETRKYLAMSSLARLNANVVAYFEDLQGDSKNTLSCSEERNEAFRWSASMGMLNCGTTPFSTKGPEDVEGEVVLAAFREGRFVRPDSSFRAYGSSHAESADDTIGCSGLQLKGC